jgi:hypothetical protein
MKVSPGSQSGPAPGIKVFLLLFLQKKKIVVLFLQKKNQKDFYFYAGERCVFRSPKTPEKR